MMVVVMRLQKPKKNSLMQLMLLEDLIMMMLLAQVIETDDDNGAVLEVIKSIVSGKDMEAIVKCLELESTEERVAAMKILLRCIQQDGKCRNIIANKAELGLVLECFLEVNDEERFEIVQFLSELVKLNRWNQER